MKTKKPVLNRLILAASVLICCALHLPAQTAPTITTQPANQTNLAGANVTFSVTVAGTGPFTYQWQFNGTNLPNNIITTVAGNGTATYAGDGGAATNASLYYPTGVTVDAAGNLYIADYLNNRIRKVDPNGIITTVAGNGSGTYSGDGGAATNASVHDPYGVTVDAAGNLYIADDLNNRIRKVDPNGNITTAAGNGTGAYAGDGGAATNASLHNAVGVAVDATGKLYIADDLNNRIRKVDTNGIISTVAGNGNATYAGDGGMATNASLHYPASLVFDSAANLYFADYGNNRIRMVGTNGVITTVAGKSSQGYSGDGGAATNASLDNPWGVALDVSANLYIADSGNNRIRKVDPNGIITTVAGNGNAGYSGDGGAATNASVYSPLGVALDAVGNLYIADTRNNRMREVHFAGYPTFTITNVGAFNAGSYTVVITNASGSVTSAVAALVVLMPPSIVVQPASQGAVAGANVALRVTAAGTEPLYYSWYFSATNLLQSGTNSTLAVQDFSTNDAGNYIVVVTNAYGTVASRVATLTLLPPPSVVIAPCSQTVFAGTNVSFSVTAGGPGPLSYQWQFNGTNLPSIITTVAGNGHMLNGAGGYSGDGGAATNAALNLAPNMALASGVALNASGNLYIADTINDRIRKVDTNGIITTVAGNGAGAFYDSGAFSGDGGAATNASLYWPTSVAVDAAGDLYIADTYNQRIRKVATNGVITTVAGKGTAGYSGDGGAATNTTLNYPSGVAFDGFGNLYIDDNDNGRIRKVDINGVITTVAGNGTAGYSGDGGAATNASLHWPQGVAIDGVGNLYIDDLYNQRIRKVDTNGIITTVAGNGNYGYFGDGGAATNASLWAPRGVTLDAYGNLYIADYGNNSIRKVNTNGIITTVAGNGSKGYAGDGGAATSASLYGPSGVGFDASGNLYIADANNQRIREVHLAGYPTLTLTNVGAINAGNYAVIITSPYGSVTSAVATLIVEAPPVITLQPASQIAVAGSSSAFSVAVAGSGPYEYFWYFESTNLLQSGTNSGFTVAGVSTNDGGNYTVVVTNAYGSVTSQVASLTVGFPPSVTALSGGQTVLAGTNVSWSVVVGGGGPYTYQWQFNGAKFPNNIITTVAGNGIGINAGDGGAAINASLHCPRGVAFDGAGNLYIADQNNSRIRKVDTNGVITTVAGNGTNGYSGDGGAATNASLSYPTSVALDAAGNLYVSDMDNGRIRKVDTNGIITSIATTGATFAAYGPVGVALDTVGNLYVADQNSYKIVKVNSSGTATTFAGGNGYSGPTGDGGPATAADISFPQGVAFDAAGNLYIADQGKGCIRKVNPIGIISTVAGNGTNGYYSGDGGAATNARLRFPYGVALDAAGNLYIADYLNNRIREVDTNGIINTVAGNGSTNFSGDGGAATNASLALPACVTLDAAGNLCIADYGNNCIREVHFAGYPTLALTNVSASNAGNYAVVITSPYGSVTSAVSTLTVQAPPLITVQPTNQTVLAGSSPIFSVAVVGSGPFGYSWYFAGTNLLQSDTNNTLTLPCVFTNNAGNYTVVVTNAYGCVTSAVAALAVTIPRTAPQVIACDASFGFLTNQFGFNLSGAFGQTIVVDGSTNLVDWTPLFTNTVGGVGPVYFCDPGWTNFGWRFYRGRLP